MGSLKKATSEGLKTYISTNGTGYVRKPDYSNVTTVTKTGTGKVYETYTATDDCWIAAFIDIISGSTKNGCNVVISGNDSVAISGDSVDGYGSDATTGLVYVPKGQTVKITWSGYNASTSGMNKYYRIWRCK
jgi:hypothetical protein